ncbi:MAG TPA: hypothetical protein VN948_18585 [Terriglobales bacterium]|nr:hypothetical protein [Terriglobales bacterium]
MKLLRVFCVFCGLVVPGCAVDREAFTFINYDLNVRVEPEQRRLGVRGRITLRNDSTTPQKDIALQVTSTLEWRSIQIGGKAVEFVTHEYTSDLDHTGALSEAIVTLPQGIPSKGTVELEVGYEGVIPLNVTRLTRIGVPEDKAKHSDWDQISKPFTLVRGIGYVSWYPVATEAASLSEGNSVFATLGRWKRRETDAQMQMNLCSISREASFSVVRMNGTTTGVPAEEPGVPPETSSSCVTHRFVGFGIMVPVLAVAQYSVLDRPNISIGYITGHKPGAENYALATELATPLVTEWFGAPRQNAQVAEQPDSEAASFESGTMLVMPLNSSDSRAYQLTAVHQLTHTAFHSPRPWIYEGLAHFAQALEREQQNGRPAALDFMGSHLPAMADAEKAVAAAHSQSAADESLINTTTEEFYRSKAMYVWWVLRDMIGEAALKKALAAYHSDQDKESAYLQRLIEAQTHRDLEWFFDGWVYRDRGLPDFRVESAYPRATVNGGYIVTVTIENLGDAGAEVPVTLRMANGEVTKRLEVHAKSKAAVRIEAATTPQEVVVNDGSVPESDMSNNVFKVSPPDAAK